MLCRPKIVPGLPNICHHSCKANTPWRLPSWAKSSPKTSPLPPSIARNDHPEWANMAFIPTSKVVHWSLDRSKCPPSSTKMKNRRNLHSGKKVKTTNTPNRKKTLSITHYLSPILRSQPSMQTPATSFWWKRAHLTRQLPGLSSRGVKKSRKSCRFRTSFR